jgi:uncharacterized protein involved in outer membrane biogenesis
MNKPIVKILVIIVVVVVGLGIAKNALTQIVLSSAISKAAHVPVKIGGVNLSLLSASLRIKNLKVSNPSGYPEKVMMDVPQIFVDFDPKALSQGKAHFEEVNLDLKELVVIKRKDGALNVDAVKPTEAEKKASNEKAKAPKGGKAPKLMIDKLTLSIGRVVYKDYSTGGEPNVQTFDVNIQNREFHNIDNPATVVSLLMFEALTRTTLGSLANLDVDAFKEGGLQALSKGLGVVTEGTDAAQDTAKGLLNLLNN